LHSNRKSKAKISLSGICNGVTQAESEMLSAANAEIIATLKVILGALDGVVEQMRTLGSKNTVSAKHLLDGIEYIRRSHMELRR
jgi:hypothetical protein